MPLVVGLLESYKDCRNTNRNRIAERRRLTTTVPQHRKRLIVGDPDTVARLQRAPLVHRSIRDGYRNRRAHGFAVGVIVSKRRPDPERPGRWIYKYYGEEDLEPSGRP